MEMVMDELESLCRAISNAERSRHHYQDLFDRALAEDTSGAGGPSYEDMGRSVVEGGASEASVMANCDAKRTALGTAIKAAHTSIGKLLNAAYNVTIEAGKYGKDSKTLGMIDKKKDNIMLLPGC